MVNRDRHDIVIEILRDAMSKRKKTELMADVSLSYLQTKQYLDMLVEKGLLEIDQDHHLKTTKKGAEYLEKCSECQLFPWEKQKRETAI